MKDDEPISEHYYIKEFSEGADIPPVQKREYTRVDMERMFLYGLLNQRHPSGTFMDEIGEQLKDDKVRDKIALCLKEIDSINASGNSKEGSEPKADHRLIDWPSEEEILTESLKPFDALNGKTGNMVTTYSAGFIAAIAWLSSRLQEETNVNTDKK